MVDALRSEHRAQRQPDREKRRRCSAADGRRLCSPRSHTVFSVLGRRLRASGYTSAEFRTLQRCNEQLLRVGHVQEELRPRNSVSLVSRAWTFIEKSSLPHIIPHRKRNHEWFNDFRVIGVVGAPNMDVRQAVQKAERRGSRSGIPVALTVFFGLLTQGVSRDNR